MRKVQLATHGIVLILLGGATHAEQGTAPARAGEASVRADGADAAAKLPPGYTIGAGDVLNIVFWREPEMSGEVVVRPDGKITVPLIKELTAGGLTPAQLEAELAGMAKRYIQEPNATVVVKEIRSRQIFITGMVARPGAYALNGPMTILQFIAQAGGLLEYADAEGVRIVRNAEGSSATLNVNFKEISKGKNLAQNVELKPGDTVVVP